MTKPDPMTPADCDLRGYEYMPLMGHRLFGSTLYAEATDAEFRASIRLWWSAWNQCPAGSLPNSDAALAMLSDYGRDLKGWLKVKDMALRGFVLCSDGRLYHPVLCDAAVKAYALRLKADTKRKADAERLRLWREAKRKAEQGGDGNDNGNADETRFTDSFDTPDETRDVAERREEKRREEKLREEREPRTPPLPDPTDAPAEPSPTDVQSSRGTRLRNDWEPGAAERDFATALGLDPDAIAAEFRDYWLAVPGTRGRKLDWAATFRNRCRERAAAAPVSRENATLRRMREQAEMMDRLTYPERYQSDPEPFIDHDPEPRKMLQ